MVKNLPAMQETWVWSLGQEDSLEKGMATHSSILAWRIPWTEEPGGLQSIGSQRGSHYWATNTSFIFACPESSLRCVGFLWLRWGEATLQLWCVGFSLQWLLLLRSTELQSVGSGERHRLSYSVARGIFLEQERIRVPCTGRRILLHCTTREALLPF